MIATQAITLFVDDAPSLLDIIKSRLIEIGYRAVEIAANVDEAYKVIASRPVGHVVSDWRMESPGGVALLRRIRAEHPSIRCTLLTGFIKELPEAERSLLSAMDIELADKEQVSTAWLARLVGYENYTPSVEAEEDAEMAIQEVVSGPADIIAQQRLRIEELERVILCVAEDLVREIESIKISYPEDAIIGGKSKFSIRDLAREIKLLTPMGRRLIELDRAARQRISRRHRG